MAFDRADGLVGIGDRLPLRLISDEDFAVLAEGDDARGGAVALGVGDDRGLAALEDGDDGVGGAEVDADCSCHVWGAPCETGVSVREPHLGFHA